MRTPPQIAAELEAAFARIHRERMADVPILNEALRVEAVGFVARGDEALGVLVTPWFMNLMLVPAAGSEQRLGDKTFVSVPAAGSEQRPGDKTFVSVPAAGGEQRLGDKTFVSVPAAGGEQRPGDKTFVSFPGGDLEFIAAYEDGIGDYRMCSLFSPVFEFADHDTAVATAAAVMERLLTEAEGAGSERAQAPRTLSRRQLFQRMAGGE